MSVKIKILASMFKFVFFVIYKMLANLFLKMIYTLLDED